MARVCFLFNHDALHQVAHSLPIAQAMAAEGRHEIVLATGSEAIAGHLAAAAGPHLPVTLLALSRTGSRLAATLLDGLIPAKKIVLYRDNLDFFRSFDTLVVSEKTTLLLKDRYGLDDLKIIHTRHGAGDRAIGFGPESARFDLVLVSGPKIARRLSDEAGLDPSRIRITGYPKFDLCAENSIANPFPDPSRKTVLYAPHPSPKLSSWFGMGPDILRAFAACTRYNLVFAPHVMLFQRRWTVTIAPPAIAAVPQPPPEAVEAPHILIDTGSPQSSDMSYTNLADLYLGDVSSQVYEFLYKPRPVLHINAHGADWRDDPNYAHWQAGPVMGAGDDVLTAVDAAFASHADYRTTQEAMLADTFSVTDAPASTRAAQAISAYLTGGEAA